MRSLCETSGRDRLFTGNAGLAFSTAITRTEALLHGFEIRIAESVIFAVFVDGAWRTTTDAGTTMVAVLVKSRIISLTGR